MIAANMEHKETLQRMEQKFFEEKVRKKKKELFPNKIQITLKLYTIYNSQLTSKVNVFH